ncbi:MAG TPA: VWA domain-containing protein, partial [Candidatus Limnocylindrales bacterium]
MSAQSALFKGLLTIVQVALIGTAVLVTPGLALASGQGPSGASSDAQAAARCGFVPLDVEFIIDTSGSMGSNSSGTPPQTRMYWAKAAATQLVNALDAPGNGGVGGATGIHHVGVTRFSGTTASVVGALGTATATTVNGWISGLSATGNTPLQTGMATGAGDMNANARNAVGGAVQRIFILLTDGRPNPDLGPNGTWATTGVNNQRPTDPEGTAYLGSADIAYSIAIGAGGSGSSAVDLGLMQLLDKPNGRYHNVVDADDLPALFDDIFTEISCPPHLVVEKTVNKAAADPGDTLNYTISLTNDGGSNATGVAVHDDISALLAHGTFGTCDNGCTNDADSVDWSGLSVAVGATLNLHFSINLSGSFPAGTTDLPNTVLVASTNCSADTQDPDCSTNTTVTVAKNPHLSIDKVDNTGSFNKVDDVISYTITATNDGNVTLHNVGVTDD